MIARKNRIRLCPSLIFSRMGHPPRKRRARPSLRSPFLNLPAEIRIKIYTAALVSPEPIDLCPATYVIENFDSNPVFQHRSEVFRRSDESIPVGRIARPKKLAFRLQSSLQYVRQHLAVQLLAVCCQIYEEAARYFWGCNIWRFSDDQEWGVLLRFLLTIGPNARSMIRRLEALAPVAGQIGHATGPRPSSVPDRSEWIVKNEPKLRMSKLFHDHYRHDTVWRLWMQERSLRRLDLIVPTGYELGFPDPWSNNRHNSRWAIDNSFYVDEYFMECLAKTRVVVEAGGVLYEKQRALQQGWDVLALPGSEVFENPPPDQHKLWESDVDYLTGVPQLFAIDDVSVHVNGEKINNAPEQIHRIRRQLKAFGPCIIRVDDIPCECWRCTSRSLWNRPYYTHPRWGITYQSLVDVHESEMLEWLASFNICD